MTSTSTRTRKAAAPLVDREAIERAVADAAAAAAPPEPLQRDRSVGRVVADTLGHVRSLDDDPAAAARHAWPLLTESLLPDLAGLGVTTPPEVQRVLDLAAATRAFAAAESDFPAWLAAQDLADLTPAAMYAAYRDRRAAGDREVLTAVDWELLNRALDALAGAADEITIELRRQFDGPAATMATAVAAGLHEGLRAETAIGDDQLVHHWRAFMVAVPNAARVHAVYYRLLLVAGFALAPGERALAAGVEWMRASTGGPVELALPSARTVPPMLDYGTQSARSGTAVDLQHARQVGFDRDRAETAAAHERTTSRLAEFLVGDAAGLLVLDDPAPAAVPDGTTIPVLEG